MGTIAKKKNKAKRDKTKIGVGTPVIVKVGEIDEKIREGKRRRMRKYMVDCLSHIASVLLFSHFWWLVTVFSLQMVNSR